MQDIFAEIVHYAISNHADFDSICAYAGKERRDWLAFLTTSAGCNLVQDYLKTQEGGKPCF